MKTFFTKSDLFLLGQISKIDRLGARCTGRPQITAFSSCFVSIQPLAVNITCTFPTTKLLLKYLLNQVIYGNTDNVKTFQRNSFP